MKRGIIVVISAPSGAGKSTLSKELLRIMPEIRYSISLTTRAPRSGEVDGREYHFVTEDEFNARKNADELIEFAYVHGYWYGTPKNFIEENLAAGRDVLLDIDVQGGRNIKKIFLDAALIFIAPPSFSELESRLRGRRQDDEATIRKRLQAAMDELLKAREYDYLVLNEKIPVALEQLKSIIIAEHCKMERNRALFSDLKLPESSSSKIF